MPKRPSPNVNTIFRPPQAISLDNTNPRKRKRGKRGGSGEYWATGEGDTEEESEEEEGEGYGGGISVGMAGLGVVSADGKAEKGPRLCVPLVFNLWFLLTKNFLFDLLDSFHQWNWRHHVR